MTAAVPRDIICLECALHHDRGPPNFLTCAFPRHKKPSWRNVVDIAENWIPGLSIASLGVDLFLTRWVEPAKPTPKTKGTGTQKSKPKKPAMGACNMGVINFCTRCAHGAPRV